MSASILIVDDDKAFQLIAKEALSAEGFDVRTVGNLARASVELDSNAPDVLLLDRRLPDGDGLDFLAARRTSGGILTIMVTAYGDVENAVAALRAGAADYLTKPISVTDLVIKLRKVLEARGLRDRLHIAKGGAVEPRNVAPQSVKMQEAVNQLLSVAQSPTTPVLILGESGVGKQKAAELLHDATYRLSDPDAPFLQVNCAALPAELVESELFGHEQGAFTDARNMRRGLVEMASGGTLFLDEIGEMPLRMQAKLLTFLDSLRFRRVGGQREIAVSLRVVAATNRNLDDEVTAGNFRSDLLHRLRVFTVAIPRLTDRLDDLPALAETFVELFATQVKKPVRGISADAIAALRRYHFPGNVRELRNMIQRAVILTTNTILDERDFALPTSGAVRGPISAPGDEFFNFSLQPDGRPHPLHDVEKAYVARVLEFCGGHRTAAATVLQISYPTFLKRLRELQLE